MGGGGMLGEVGEITQLNVGTQERIQRSFGNKTCNKWKFKSILQTHSEKLKDKQKKTLGNKSLNENLN